MMRTATRAAAKRVPAATRPFDATPSNSIGDGLMPPVGAVTGTLANVVGTGVGCDRMSVVMYAPVVAGAVPCTRDTTAVDVPVCVSKTT